MNRDGLGREDEVVLGLLITGGVRNAGVARPHVQRAFAARQAARRSRDAFDDVRRSALRAFDPHPVCGLAERIANLLVLFLAALGELVVVAPVLVLEVISVHELARSRRELGRGHVDRSDDQHHMGNAGHHGAAQESRPEHIRHHPWQID